MEYTLVHLIDSLQSTLKVLKGDANTQLKSALHNHERLPDKQMANLASRAIDLLHETEQLLEPGPSVLADHFLGWCLSLIPPNPCMLILRIEGYVNSKCLCAAVSLKIPDILRGGPKTLPDLAITSGARPDRLRQVLRVLYNNGIFGYNASTDVYSNNTTSTLLLSDHWTQWTNWVDLYGNEFYDMARGIPESCRADAVRMPGQINFDTDKDMFTYFTEQGWLKRLHKTLSGGAVAQSLGILEDYPWGEVAESTFLDVGGGFGGLVALLLRNFPNMRAGILDIPKVIEQSKLSFHTPDGQYADIGDRVALEHLIAGDFLVEIPSFEVYTMKWCLHDWDNSKALRILSNIRRSILKGPRSRLVLLESLLKDGRMGRLSRYGDITMMVSANGQERDESQWRALAKESGWEVNRIFPLRSSWPCAIELVPAWEFITAVSGVGYAYRESQINGERSINGNSPVNGESEANDVSHVDDEGHINGGDHIGRNNNAVQMHGIDEPADLNGIKTRLVANSLGQFTSHMSFLEPWESSKSNPFYRSAPAEGFESTNFKWVDHPVKVTDIRPIKDDFILDKQAFQFCTDPEDLSQELLSALCSNDTSVVKKLYYPRIERLIKDWTGAPRVIIFDHTVRKRDPGMDRKENPNGREQPATVVSL